MDELPEDVRAALRLAGQHYAKRRQRATYTCQQCGRTFSAIARRSPVPTYCGGACRTAAYRQRQQGAPPGDTTLPSDREQTTQQ